MSDNLYLWNKVESTNPAHTKKVKFGRAITAIDPYHQLKNATEQFGPAGEGWGWSVVDTQFLPINEVACLVRVWHGDSGKYIEQWGQAGLYLDNDEQKKDSDCMKKATTDGITKCLSMLGFNADIFLGLFEDNKYVADQKDKFAKEKLFKEVLEFLGDDVIKQYQDLVKAGNPIEFFNFMSQFKPKDPSQYDPTIDALSSTWPAGEKTKMNKAHMELNAKFTQVIQQVSEDLVKAISDEDDQGIVENWDEIGRAKAIVMKSLSPEHVEYLKNRKKTEEE